MPSHYFCIDSVRYQGSTVVSSFRFDLITDNKCCNEMNYLERLPVGEKMRMNGWLD